MAKPAQVQVEGAREVRKALTKVGAGTRDMTQVHRRVAARVVPAAQDRTRLLTGGLAGSYRVRASAAKAAIASNLVYAPVQEFGWPARGITPSLALTGAVEAARQDIADTYQRYVADVIARHFPDGA